MSEHMHLRSLSALFGLILLVATGCDAVEPLAPSDPDPLNLNVVRGETAFLGECARCHASGDGFDLAFFQFPDTTIVRRALAHVTESTANDIVAYIESLATHSASRHARAFQPLDVVLSDDRAFAAGLFGMDGIPPGLDTEALLAIDPLDVAVAVPLPQWSIEESSLDWMPDRELPESILDDRDSLPRARLALYYSEPTLENLGLVVAALRSADRRRNSSSATCIFDDPARVDHESCFQTRRWTASLVAQHMLRHGMSDPIHPILHDTWWDVGNVARKSVNARLPIDDAEMNWAAWMYLGWAFDPGRHASIYTGLGLNRLGLPRHATFVGLKSIVSRPEGSRAVWPDARSVAQFAPSGWALDATRIAYVHLLERLDNGERPTDEEGLTEARMFVNRAFDLVQRKVSDQGRLELAALRDELLAILQ